MTDLMPLQSLSNHRLYCMILTLQSIHWYIMNSLVSFLYDCSVLLPKLHMARPQPVLIYFPVRDYELLLG
jgi:hypothetical protein